MQIKLLFKTSFAILIILGLCLPVIPFGYFGNSLSASNSSFSAGSIDLGLNSPTENFYPPEVAFNMKLGDSVYRTVKVSNIGTNPFNYFLKIEKISGDDDFCNALQLEVVIEGPPGPPCPEPEPPIEPPEPGPEPEPEPEPEFSPMEIRSTQAPCQVGYEFSSLIGLNIVSPFELYPGDENTLFFTITFSSPEPEPEPTPTPEIEGCTDPVALNYNPEATIDDGSCTYPEPEPPIEPGPEPEPEPEFSPMEIGSESSILSTTTENEALTVSEVSKTLQNKTCQFKFIFTAQQFEPPIEPEPGPEPEPPYPDPEPEPGVLTSSDVSILYFSDTEEITNTLKSGQLEAKPDFWIEEIRPVQVVWDSKIDDNDKIDLVAGKATMVRVYVGKEDYEALPKNLPLDVRLTLTDYGFDFPKTESRTIEQLEQNNWEIDFYPISLEEPGNHVIRAKVDSKEIDEADENNNRNSVWVTVKNTIGLDIKYFRVERPESYSAPYYPYEKTVEKSGEFIQATYPISEVEFINEPRSEIIEGHAKTTVGSLYFGIARDSITINNTAKRLGANRGVGIVPWGYFEYHGTDAGGMYFPLIGGVVSEAGYWTSPAHEIGHTYGLPPGLAREEYTEDYDGNPASGFWVSKKQPIENGICFMGRARDFESFGSTWICDHCYSYLFKQFKKNKNDPRILLLSGIIYKDGTLKLEKWYKMEEGEDNLDEIIPGNYSLQILDENKNILQEISFSAEFWASIDPIGIVEIDFVPFTFSIPYPQDASFIKILHKNEPITDIDLTTKLLNDAMDTFLSDYNMLIRSVEGADIQHGVKNSLLSKLINAKKKTEQGIIYINDGRYIQGKNMVNSASNIVDAFINEINAQKGKKISEEDANGFIGWAQKMILSIQNQIIENL